MAVRTAVEGLRKNPPLPVAAVMLLDAVEGTAIDGFPKTEAWFRCRPTSFQTLDDAVAWATSSRMLHSRVVAEVSVPSRLLWCSSHTLTASLDQVSHFSLIPHL